jgi:hypothetical protein
VTALLWIYQRGRAEALPVRITAPVVDGDRDVWSSTTDMGKERFATAGEVGYRIAPLVQTLASGQCPLEIVAADGRSVVRRDVRFWGR